MSVNWDTYNNTALDEINKKYFVEVGQGKNMASQIVVACNKLVWQYYNNGVVFDRNIYKRLFDVNCVNDCSSVANWLNKYCDNTFVKSGLETCFNARNRSDYEDGLYNIVTGCLTTPYLKEYKKMDKKGDIFNCDGRFTTKDWEEYEFILG